jgi:cation transport protein ChaC
MQALAFIVRRDHSQYAGELDMAKQARVIASACGAFGSSADYLERTRVALVSHGIVDPYLESLAKAVGKLCPPAAPAEGHEPGEPPV